jgi:protein-S-isoprenylcysteine O-methyltransferase Ste14
MRVPDLGSRGQGWVYLQFVLMAAVVVGFVPPRWPEAVARPFDLVGAIFAVGGAFLAVWAARTLGRSLTPFPAPAPDGTLVATGPYRIVRHPVYAAGIVFFLGVALVIGPWALVPTAALCVVWSLKLQVEERFLRGRFPDYTRYCQRVPARLVPGVF